MTGPPTDLVVTSGGAPLAVDPAELEDRAWRLRAAAEAVELAAERLTLFEQDLGAAVAATGLQQHMGVTRTELLELIRVLRALADRLDTLADHLTQLRYIYGGVDSAVSGLFTGTRPWRPLANLLPRWAVPLVLPPPLLAATYAGDAARIAHAAIATYGQMLSHEAPDSTVVAAGVRALAPDLQHMGQGAALGAFAYRDQDIDVSGLSPVQRSALLAASWTRAASRGLAPGRGYEDVRARPVGPDGQRRAMIGLAATPQALPTRFAEPVATPRSTAEALERIDATNAHLDAHGGGAIEILRTETAAGGRHWTVLIPGTKAVTAGGRNPMDNETNFLGVAGQRTDMEIAVVQAMERAGIGRHEPVSVLGHSQGGIVATRIAADPVLQRRFDLATVVTAGSPTGTIDGIPDTSHVLHLEDSQDPTVGVDGTTNPSGPHRTTVTQLSDEPSSFASAHHLERYTQMAGRLDELEDPGVRRFLAASAEAMAHHDDSAVTHAFRFTVERY